MAQPPTERRMHPRHEYRAPLQFRPSVLFAATALDLSESGITFETTQPVSPGATLEMVLIDGNVQINGRVVDVHTVNGGNLRVGLEFDSPQPELVDVLTAAWQARHS